MGMILIDSFHKLEALVIVEMWMFWKNPGITSTNFLILKINKINGLLHFIIDSVFDMVQMHAVHLFHLSILFHWESSLFRNFSFGYSSVFGVG